MCLRCSNKGLSAGGPKLHEHAVLQGKNASGANLTAAAAVYPPALRRSTFARVGAHRRLCEGSWTAAGGSSTSQKTPGRRSWSCRGLQRRPRR
eukprot:9042757-Alexandrium_andersonii.AAC.1